MASTDNSRRRPFLEVQYHPSDIRKGVRYLFFTRRQAFWIGAVAVAWLLIVVNGLVLAPAAISDLLAHREYAQLREERAEEGERLKERVAELAELEGRTEEARLRMAKVYLAYGFSEKEGSHGKGGYPHAPEGVPHSIFSDVIRRGNGLLARIGEQMGVLESFLGEVQSFEEAHRDQVRTTPSIIPLRGEDFVLTSPYGTRTSPFTKEIDFHAGIDLAAPVGTPIYAPADGVVAFAGRYPLKQSVGWWRYGNLVAMKNGDRFITLFGHCDEISVRAGDQVKQGDVIGTVGNSGWSTNPHLHYEIRRLEDDGEYKPVDPRIYILDHRWRDEERVLVRARTSPDARDFEPLPRVIQR